MRQKTGLSPTEIENRNSLRKPCLVIIRHWYLLMAKYEIEIGDIYFQKLVISGMNNAFKFWRQTVNKSGTDATRNANLS